MKSRKVYLYRAIGLFLLPFVYYTIGSIDQELADDSDLVLEEVSYQSESVNLALLLSSFEALVDAHADHQDLQHVVDGYDPKSPTELYLPPFVKEAYGEIHQVIDNNAFHIAPSLEEWFRCDHYFNLQINETFFHIEKGSTEEALMRIQRLGKLISKMYASQHSSAVIKGVRRLLDMIDCAETLISSTRSTQGIVEELKSLFQDLPFEDSLSIETLLKHDYLLTKNRIPTREGLPATYRQSNLEPPRISHFNYHPHRTRNKIAESTRVLVQKTKLPIHQTWKERGHGT